MKEEAVRLTQYSHGAGCGCKIAPAVLSEILAQTAQQPHFPGLLVGNETLDDAAVYDLGTGQSVVSTTDIFKTKVDDPQDFGRIAAANAISDIYAMGARPLMAIAILGWPIDKLSPEIAGRVLEGGRDICNQAGIPLAGGHSIDCPEPIFGLAVTGLINTHKVVKNGGARPGDRLYLTKPIGVGMVTTAEKKGLADPTDITWAKNLMKTLNSAGTRFSDWQEVRAMTDVTGFGLLGHLLEMCRASGTSAQIRFADVPQLNPDRRNFYLDNNAIPGGTMRNFNACAEHLSDLSPLHRNVLCDPQTSGGLLVAVDPEGAEAFERKCRAELGLEMQSFGAMVELEGRVRVDVG